MEAVRNDSLRFFKYNYNRISAVTALLASNLLPYVKII